MNQIRVTPSNRSRRSTNISIALTLMTMTMNDGGASSKEAPIVTFKASPKGPKCPFTNSISFQLFPGSCVLLKGNSGAGKTTLSTYLASLCDESTLEKLDIQATCQWDPSIPKQEQCGVLFQQTTLLDELTVAGNVSVALGGTTRHCRIQAI